MTARRLKDATSPYLQQHADNPVDWWPWCEEALELARSEDRPILLSIGYSACHWCHVMAHESFEDPATAELMNRLFVNIKVDREERPDLDKVYQTAHQLLARRPGGWPLTVFLTPDDHSPFFAGTYFPPQPRHGLPAFRDLLRQIEGAYREQREAINEQNTSLQQALTQTRVAAAAAKNRTTPQSPRRCASWPASSMPNTAASAVRPSFRTQGPCASCCAMAHRAGDDSARHMALLTLERMANGGINDHLGGGFCRYSVDGQWMIPHFEKMLYDNGQLLALYAEAWAAGDRRPLFRHVCERTAEWLMREMQSPLGGYYASLDADSEGEEGRFYVWDPDEVAALLDAGEYRVFAPASASTAQPTSKGDGICIPTSTRPGCRKSPASRTDAIRELLLSARNKLLAERDKRVRPARDEKILTSWNALMIKGMAAAGRLLDRPDWIDSAERALRYLLEHHWRDGRLLATSRDGKARLNAYLDDYAYLIDAIARAVAGTLEH